MRYWNGLSECWFTRSFELLGWAGSRMTVVCRACLPSSTPCFIYLVHFPRDSRITSKLLNSLPYLTFISFVLRLSCYCLGYRRITLSCYCPQYFSTVFKTFCKSFQIASHQHGHQVTPVAYLWWSPKQRAVLVALKGRVVNFLLPSGEE
jgi:hypothetical protein